MTQHKQLVKWVKSMEVSKSGGEDTKQDHYKLVCSDSNSFGRLHTQGGLTKKRLRKPSRKTTTLAVDRKIKLATRFCSPSKLAVVDSDLPPWKEYII